MKNTLNQFIAPSIVINFTVEGFHCWPEAKDHFKQVAFLSDIHRHTFHFKVTIPVSHGDRDIEIILYKRQIIEWLRSHFYSEELNALDFGRLSCEQLGQMIALTTGATSVEVLEDGENGAISTNYNNMRFEDIVAVYGPLCSGKTTFCNILSLYKYKHIKVSDIVKRSIKEFASRKDLQASKHLEREIAASLVQEVRKGRRVVIDGIRQKGIVEELCREMNVTHVKLTTPISICKERYDSRSRDIDTESFDRAYQRDVDLGYEEMMSYLIKLPKVYQI